MSIQKTLEILYRYIHSCDGLINLVLSMNGSIVKALAVSATAATHPELASRLPLEEFLQPDGSYLS